MLFKCFIDDWTMQLLITFDPRIMFLRRACRISLQLHRCSVQDLETRNLYIYYFLDHIPSQQTTSYAMCLSQSSTFGQRSLTLVKHIVLQRTSKSEQHTLLSKLSYHSKLFIKHWKVFHRPLRRNVLPRSETNKSFLHFKMQVTHTFSWHWKLEEI